MDMKLGDTQLILKRCREHYLTKDQAAYVLATAYHETAHTMKPVREAFWLSEQWRADNLRYYPYYGRGYVQLTWKSNYERASSVLGVDFVNNKDAVMDPKYASHILVVGMKEGWFTGVALNDYINDYKTDFYHARQIVNRMDKATLIAKLAEEYLAHLDRPNWVRRNFTKARY